MRLPPPRGFSPPAPHAWVLPPGCPVPSRGARTAGGSPGDGGGSCARCAPAPVTGHRRRAGPAPWPEMAAAAAAPPPHRPRPRSSSGHRPASPGRDPRPGPVPHSGSAGNVAVGLSRAGGGGVRGRGRATTGPRGRIPPHHGSGPRPEGRWWGHTRVSASPAPTPAGAQPLHSPGVRPPASAPHPAQGEGPGQPLGKQPPSPPSCLLATGLAIASTWVKGERGEPHAAPHHVPPHAQLRTCRWAAQWVGEGGHGQVATKVKPGAPLLPGAADREGVIEVLLHAEALLIGVDGQRRDPLPGPARSRLRPPPPRSGTQGLGQGQCPKPRGW